MAARVSLRHLRCFVAVADTGSFTAAATRLFLTQSSLTATIQQLEASIGLRLFDRTTRRVEMTNDAVTFKTVAEKIIRDFDTAIGDLQAVADSQRGHVRIAATPSMVAHIVHPMLTKFRQIYPKINLTVHDGDSNKIENAVLNGEIDFGISNRLNDFADLTYTSLLSDPFGVVCPAAHQLASVDGEIAWADIQDLDYIGLASDTGIGAQIESVTSFSMRNKLANSDQASSTTSLYILLNISMKYSILPSLAAADRSLAGFIFRRLKEPRLDREICLITRGSRAALPNTQRMLDFLKETVRKSHFSYARALI